MHLIGFTAGETKVNEDEGIIKEKNGGVTSSSNKVV